MSGYVFDYIEYRVDFHLKKRDGPAGSHVLLDTEPCDSHSGPIMYPFVCLREAISWAFQIRKTCQLNGFWGLWPHQFLYSACRFEYLMVMGPPCLSGLQAASSKSPSHRPPKSSVGAAQLQCRSPLRALSLLAPGCQRIPWPLSFPDRPRLSRGNPLSQTPGMRSKRRWPSP